LLDVGNPAVDAVQPHRVPHPDSVESALSSRPAQL
jgi:hypothetical protein